jgi:EAL and modified HD-GYP domain-containing signal transduction protein
VDTASSPSSPSSLARRPRDEPRLARQPILDRHLRTHGYELLFRGPRDEVPDTDAWTASLLVDGIAEAGLAQLVGGAWAYLNVSRSFLLHVDPLPFGPSGVVLELTEDSHHTDDVLLERLHQLVADGYRLALDDYTYDPSHAPLLELASVVKLDVLADGLDRTAAHVEALRPWDVELLAEKVETREEFESCLDMGFDTFQGYFFARPKVVATTGVSADRTAALNTVARLTRPGLRLEELEGIIASDVGLTYKLLRYINSGFFSLSSRVRTAHDAIVLLGETRVRQWAIVMAIAGAGRHPAALVSLALLRARLCQGIAAARGHAEGAAFMVGLFSVLDALLDIPMVDALGRLPLTHEVNEALLGHGGPLGEILDGVVNAERGGLAILAEIGADAYQEAATWADAAAAAAA